MADDVVTDREVTIDATETNPSTTDNEAPEKTTTWQSVATDTNTNMDTPHTANPGGRERRPLPKRRVKWELS
jgi:hypothetical protein